MDFTLKNMFDTFKNEVWEELGPLDPDWFETLTLKPFTSEENVSDEDDLCPNQEGNCKATFYKNAVDSQLVSTPKVLRHCLFASPGTEDDQSFNTDQERDAPAWAGTQSPHLSQESKEIFQDSKLCDLQYRSQDNFNLHNTPRKSDVSYGKRISEALGVDTHTDVSWTSSLNTPTASTLILTKLDESPCPVSLSEEQNVVIVRKLFPSLSNAGIEPATPSGVGGLSPQKSCTATANQDAVACELEDTLESLDSSQASRNQNEYVWRQKLPDAIQDGEIRNTIASAIDGAEDVLSIFFTNTNSALRKAKTDRVQRKQKVVTKDTKVAVTPPPSTVLCAEQGSPCKDRLSSPPPLKAEDNEALQWSPLSLTDIPLSAADAISHDRAKNGSKTPIQLEKSPMKVSPYANGNRKRKFVYSVKTAKVQHQEGDTQKVKSSSAILQSGQDIKLESVTDKADCSTSKTDTATLESQTKKEKQHLPEQAKLQDLDISQFSRDFAQDFSHISDPGEVDDIAKDTSWNGFSPSACLLAMKQAYRKVRQANRHADCNRPPSTTNLMTVMNESTILDSGFQSAVTDTSHGTVSWTNLESIGENLQPLDFKMDDSGITPNSASPNKRAGEEHLDGPLQEVKADVGRLEVVKETKLVTLNKKSERLGEKISIRLLGNVKKNADNGTDGLANETLPEKPSFSAPSAFPSGFKTASRKMIQISSASLAKARHLLEETERENGFVPMAVKCTENKLETSAGSLKTAHSDQLLPSTEKITVNGFQLTASQKADVTELCTVLEEADSQFEFTQFRVAKSQQQDSVASTTQFDKELESDFLSGIDFDNSFSPDGGKNQTVSLTLSPNVPKCGKVTESSAKTPNLTSKTGDLLLSNASQKEEPMADNVSLHTSDSRHSVSSEKAHNKDGQAATSTSENNDALALRVGFKTAGGNVLTISKKHLSKAKALFADLEGGVVHLENTPATVRNCDKTAELSTRYRDRFQMANGKASCLSAQTMHKAETCIKALKEEPGQRYQNIEENNLKLAKETRIVENCNTEPSVHINSSNVINVEKARVSTEVMTKTGHPENPSERCTEHIPRQAPENVGFSMASGKGVSVSSEALRKAKTLLSDCDKVGDGNFLKRVPHEPSASETASVNGGFLAANGRAVSISSEALKKTRALFSDISFTTEIPPTSLGGSKQHDDSEKDKAQNPSNESSSGAQNTLSAVDCPNAPTLKENQCAMEDSPLLCRPPERIDRPAVNKLNNRAFDSASEKRASLSDEVMKEAKSELYSGGIKEARKELKEKDSFSPQKVGFQTASGKGVSISSAALKKAKLLLSECEGAKEEAVVKDSPFKKPISGPTAKSCGLIAASDKTVGFPEAYQDAHLVSRSSKSEITVLSNSWASDYKDNSADKGVFGCGFPTAGGTKVHVSQKSLLKTKKLLNDCNLGVKCDSVAGSTFKLHESDPVEYSNTVPLKETNLMVEEHAGPSISGGFSTASGTKIAVSSEAMAKAKALLSSDPLLESPHEELKEKEIFPTHANGFQTASGKGVAISSAALKKAKALVSECEVALDENCGQAPQFKKPAPVLNSRTINFKEAPNTRQLNCGFTTAGGTKVHVSQKNLLKAKKLLSECGLGVTDADSSVKKHDFMAGSMFQQQQIGTRDEIHLKTNWEVFKRTSNGSNQTPVLVEEQSENIDCPSISTLDCGGGFNTASGKRVSVSIEAMTKAKALLNSDATHGFPPQTGGFQTASGKGFSISSTSLQKAKLLLSKPEGVKEEVDARGLPFNKTIPSSSEKNGGRPAPADKLVDFSVGLEDIAENKDAFCGSDKMHSGFMTAGGAKVHVSQKNLLKATNLLQDLGNENHFSEVLDSRSAYGLSPSGEKPAESNSNLVTWDSKRSAKEGLSHFTLTDAGITEREFAQSPRECTRINKVAKIAHYGPPEVSQLSDSLEEEMLSVLEYEMKQLSSSEAADEVEKAVEPSAVHLQSLNLSGCTETQQNFLAQEALDCTKALLEDEHLAGHGTSVDSTRMQDHPKSNGDPVEERKVRGKRMAEDPCANDQPPLKRRLLEEFDRTVVGPRGLALQPEISSPNGLMKDRRAFRYSLSLQPNITGPHRSGTKCFQSSFPQTTPSVRPGTADGKTAPSKFVPPLCRSTSKETCQTATVKDSVRASAVFIPPFKKQRVIVQDSSSEAKKKEQEEKPTCVSVMPVKIKRFVAPSEKSPSTRDAPGCKSKEDIQSAASADPSRNELENNQNLPVGCRSEESAGEASCSFLPNIELARDMQDMRIRKKKRQIIRPLPGKLFQTKTSAASRIPLRAAGVGKTPARYTREQLYRHGVHQHAQKISSETAEAFRFSLKQFVQPEVLMEAGGVQLADGGWLVPREDATAGKEEFYRSLCDTPGVDPKLISEEWVHNHYRWIVWKQAAMERTFPETMGGRCLTPHQVLLQLKYRYDVEVDHSRRSALRKIMERDDAAAKTLVLCVCGVATKGSSPEAKTPGADGKVDSALAVVWLTDGWYAIKTQLDEPLTAMLLKGRLAVGGKLITHGAQLLGSQDACSPLEAPESLMLKICANSSRPARWDSKLGFHRDPRPFLLPISSLYSSGGPVGCVDVVVLRSYPLQWMERKADGGVVFRSVRAEEREERRYNVGKQKAMEALFTKIQSDFEKEDKEKNKPQRRRRTVSRQDIASLQDGEELYEALGDDPAHLEAHLSVQQMEALQAHRRALVEKKQAEVQERYRRALEEARDGGEGCPKRDVAPVWRLHITDSTQPPGSVYQMSLWRPPSDLQSLLKEGCRYRVYNLTTSDAKKPGGTVQLTGTKKTQFEDLQVSLEWLSSRYQPRVSTDFATLQNSEFQPLCGEVDLAGYVISVIDAQGPSPAFYLADGKLNFVKVRCFSSFAQSALEDVVRPRALLALGNLQLRGQSIVPTPVVYAGDLTVFSTNPKDAHLQESLSQLKNLIQCQENFASTVEEKLLCLIKSDGLSCITSPALQAGGTPVSARDRRPDTKVAFQQSARNPGPCTPIGRKPVATNSSAEKDSCSLKRRRALDYLSRIPSPPSLSPLNPTASPCVKKTFVPPRRSGTPCTLKPVQTPIPKPVSSLVKEEWVNDEELAMIDTQALRLGSSIRSQDTV